MDEQDFLEFALCLNKAEESVRLNSVRMVNTSLDSLITQIKALPHDEDRAYLLDAAERKRQARYSLYSQEWKERLQPLAKSWCGLHKQRDAYQDYLKGLTRLDQVKDGKQKTQKFHDALVLFAGSEDKHDLIKALMRVQEAASQFLEGSDGKEKAMSKWTTFTSIKTVWQPPAKVARVETAVVAVES
jgi:hypothetical protein